MERQEQITATLEALRLHDANNTCMTVKETAGFLKVHEKTVLNKIHKGKIRATFLGTWSVPKLQFLEEIVNGQ